MALIKCPDCGREISDAAPACVHCGRPNDSVVSSNAQPTQKQPGSAKKLSLPSKLAIGAFLALCGYLLFHQDGTTQPSNSGASSPAAASTVADEASGPATSSSQEAPTPPQSAPKTLSEAIDTFRPLMTDESNQLSKGAALLALWEADNNIKWSDLTSLPRTSAALVMKDSSEERGKLICAYGQIIEISAEDTPAGKVFVGEVSPSQSENIFRFAAVRSSGNLVEGSSADFCGVVIGKFDYSNSMGGVAHAIQLVGMFKLPANMQ